MKKYLLGLFVGFVGLISFCSSYYINFPTRGTVNFSAPNNMTYYFTGGICFNYVNDLLNNWDFYSSDGTLLYSHEELAQNSNLRFLCFVSSGYVNAIVSSTLYTFSYSDGVIFGDLDSVSSSCPECQECPEVNTGEILSGYILESEINSGYCMNNNLCPESTGEITGLNRSELKINDIVHQSAPFINITIPQEFDWDYTVDENEFDLSISGYNVDTDYIDGIITVQNSKPDVSDFNKIITDLIPLFVPGLVIILFLLFVFNLIKKIF